MTSISTATPGWLALRAPADDAARSAALAADLAGMLPPGPVLVHDLGAGTGAMARWLAPRLPGPQRWVLHDGDAGILAHLDLRSAVDGAGRPIAGETSIEHLLELPLDAFEGASVVTATALLDVVTLEEAAHVVAACVVAGVPALLSLSVTGDVRLSPSSDAERDLETQLGAAFDDHQRRDAQGRRMLGPDAVTAITSMFTDAGWNVRTEATPWLLAGQDAALIAEWLDGWVGAAVEQRPDLAIVAEAYRRHRREQATAGQLRVTVGHQDVLAWPG